MADPGVWVCAARVVAMRAGRMGVSGETLNCLMVVVVVGTETYSDAGIQTDRHIHTAS